MSLFQQPLVKKLPIFGCFFLAACSNIDSQNQTTDVSDIEDQTNLVVYQCEQDELLAYFHGNRAELIWQGKSHFLTHAVSASGASYLGESLSFWAHNKEAKLEQETGKKVSCRLQKVES